MSRDYCFKLDLKVYSPEALYDAAVRHAVNIDNWSLAQCREDLRHSDDEVDIHACLEMLLDPGSIEGCDIYGSEVEQIADFAFVDTEGEGL